MNIEKLKTHDTSQILRLGREFAATSGESKAVVTQHIYEECRERNIEVPKNALVIPKSESPGINDFKKVISMNGYEAYTWSNTSTIITLQYLVQGFGRKMAICGDHESRFLLSFGKNNEVFYLCERLVRGDPDLSQITASIINPHIDWPNTGDRCLGRTSKQIMQSLTPLGGENYV